MTVEAGAARREGARFDRLGAPESESAERREPLGQLSSLLLRAHLYSMIGGARLGLKATRRIGRSQLRLLDQLTATDPSGASGERMLRVVVDEVRGCLRMIAEDAAVEARRLGAQMSRLDASAREMGDADGESQPAYRRRWKVKP